MSTLEIKINMTDKIMWGGSGIEKCLYDYIIDRLPKDSTMLEIGAGLVSTDVFSKYFNLYTIEESFVWLDKFPAKYIYSPILNESNNNWYDRTYLENKLPEKYDIVFVDGPAGEGNRVELLNNLDLFYTDCIWIFHDTYRDSEKKLAQDFADKTGKSIKFFDGCDFWAVVE
jgi:hypothetical protein